MAVTLPADIDPDLDPDLVAEASRILEAIEADEKAAESIVTACPESFVDGPLGRLTPIFVDFETRVDDGLSMSSMTLLEYLEKTDVESVSIAIGRDAPVEFFAPGFPGVTDQRLITPALIEALKRLTSDPSNVFVAYNAAFDSRVMVEKFEMAYPRNVWCAMEGAMCAWPDLPGGYSLDNCSKRLGLPHDKRKVKLDFRELSKLRVRLARADGPLPRSAINTEIMEALDTLAGGELQSLDFPTLTKLFETYNRRDVLALQEIYYRQIHRISPQEQEVGLRTHHQRQFKMQIDPQRQQELVETLGQNAAAAKLMAEEYLTEDQAQDIFNTDNGRVGSVRYQRLRNVINAMRDSEDEFTSASLKKISPVQLAKNPTVNAVLEQVSRVGKMLSHQRRTAVFDGVPETYVELGFCRAHTYRFSSPSSAKGLNLHNCISVFSLLLTQRGWVPLMELNQEDLVWDGEAFVEFAQVTLEGTRSTIKVGAAELTPEHPVWTGAQRTDAGALTPSQRAQCVVGGLSSSLRGLLAVQCESSATDAEQKLREWLTTSTNRSDAVAVRIAEALGPALTGSQTRTSSSSGSGSTTCATGTTLRPTRPSEPSNPKAPNPSAPGSARNGWNSRNGISSTSNPFLVGMIEALQLIVSTINEGMSRETCDSLVNAITTATAAILSDYQPERSSKTTATGSAFRTFAVTTFSDKAVFDIRGAGPRERFLVNGLVAFNCPKHDKAIAVPLRRTFKAPKGKVFVRADLANVEFRVEGYLTQAREVLKMFDSTRGGHIFNDPYCMSWKSMTGILISKADPVRQVAKSAVLGLGYMMGVIGYAKVLLGVLASGQVTEEGLREIIRSNGWGVPPSGVLRRVFEHLQCSETVTVAAYHIHRVFNGAYPEFEAVANWLYGVVEEIASCPPGVKGHDLAKKKIDRAYDYTAAPDRNLIGLEIDDDGISKYPSLRVRCGHWTRSVCWREPHMRPTLFGGGAAGGMRLTTLKANGLPKPFTRQLAIENVTQAAARNAMCMGVAALDRRGFRDCIHVHDEILLVVDRNREAVLAARQALIEEFGPGHSMPWSWSVLVKPDEVTVTESMYEDEDDVAKPYTNKKGKLVGNDRWGKIERNEEGCLSGLP